MILDKLNSCRHLTKLDPDREHTFNLLETVLKSGTDGIIIGGTQGITGAKTRKLLTMVRAVVGFSLPVWIEVSHQESVQLGADGYFIPVVLNTGDLKWIVGAHQKAFTSLNFMLEHLPIDLDKLLLPEGYIILNPQCAAAQKTKAKTDLKIPEIISYCLVAQHIFKLPVIYLEYSGSLGSLKVIKEVRKHVINSKLFYGGGITCPEAAYDFSRYADTVIVGNLVYQKPELLQSLVEAAKAR